ncbi:MAG: hypothetical protein FWD98_06805 [Defluviitaleaceae bacterium]|nr:hypothetical protein [Defluviitaleaceae bacterium]
MKSSIGGVNVGGSSILVIFVLLCLTTFATLAMVSATAIYRLAQGVIQASDAYFEANNRAEEMLANLSYIVRTSPEAELASRISDAGAFKDFYGNIIFIVPIDDVLLIEVELELEDQRLHILSWLMIADYDPDLYGIEILNVWPGPGM